MQYNLHTEYSLECKEKEESHHKTEQTHSLRQGESKNGIGEKLLLEGGVSGITNDQGTEHGSNTSSGSSDTDGGSSSTDKLGGGVNVCPGGGGRDESGLVDGGAD